MSFLASLPAVEEAAFSQLLAKRPDEGGLPKAQQTLAALQRQRLDYLIRRANAIIDKPDTPREQLDELIRQVLFWRKEYLDQGKPAPDSR